jgi:hypothetical protein
VKRQPHGRRRTAHRRLLALHSHLLCTSLRSSLLLPSLSSLLLLTHRLEHLNLLHGRSEPIVLCLPRGAHLFEGDLGRGEPSRRVGFGGGARGGLRVCGGERLSE